MIWHCEFHLSINGRSRCGRLISVQTSLKRFHWSAGYFAYETYDDWGLKQCCQQFFLIGWWLKVKNSNNCLILIISWFQASCLWLKNQDPMFSKCSIPFSVDDISKSIQQIEVADIDPPPLIRENSGFTFLLQRSEWSFLSPGITPCTSKNQDWCSAKPLHTFRFL